MGLPAGAAFLYVPYAVTATLSVAAVQETEIVVWPLAVVASPVGAAGAVVSGHAFVEAVIVALAERLPAASAASTASG